MLAIELSLDKIKDRFSRESFYLSNKISRQYIYKMKKSKNKKETIEQEIITIVEEVRKKNRYIGSRVLYKKLKIKTIGINKFEKIISEYKLGALIKKRRIVTTNGVYEDHDKNLINGLLLTDINKVIAGDITYLKSNDKNFYIFTLKDMYSKRIFLLGTDNMQAINALKLLKEVVKFRGKDIYNCIHHSDAGSQYKAKIYKDYLKTNNMSMSIAENCLQNGMAEQLNGLLKNGYITEEIKNVKHLNTVLKKIVKTLNDETPVKALGYKTPKEFENELKTLKEEERIKIQLYDFTKENK
jgi:putative transposase